MPCFFILFYYHPEPDTTPYGLKDDAINTDALQFVGQVAFSE
jgi:hypothetical protein